jgi:hypothetical protein
LGFCSRTRSAGSCLGGEMPQRWKSPLPRGETSRPVPLAPRAILTQRRRRRRAITSRMVAAIPEPFQKLVQFQAYRGGEC